MKLMGAVVSLDDYMVDVGGAVGPLFDRYGNCDVEVGPTRAIARFDGLRGKHALRGHDPGRENTIVDVFDNIQRWKKIHKETGMSKVMIHAVVSVDGFIADDNDNVGPLFDWYFNGANDIVDGGPFKVSQASVDYVRPMWEGIQATVMGRRLFDLTNGWEGKPPAGQHVVVVTHRPRPDGWHPEASYFFVDDVTAAITKARELAGGRTVAVAAGDVGGQALALGLVDEVAMDVVPVVFGSGRRYFGSVDGQHLLEDPDVVVSGDRVLHLRYRVRR